VIKYGRAGTSREEGMVNERTAGIFKGIFETQKSTRNGKNFAEMRVLGT
jgi:hypothetical protein